MKTQSHETKLNIFLASFKPDDLVWQAPQKVCLGYTKLRYVFSQGLEIMNCHCFSKHWTWAPVYEISNIPEKSSLYSTRSHWPGFTESMFHNANKQTKTALSINFAPLRRIESTDQFYIFIIYFLCFSKKRRDNFQGMYFLCCWYC